MVARFGGGPPTRNAPLRGLPLNSERSRVKSAPILMVKEKAMMIRTFLPSPSYSAAEGRCAVPAAEIVTIRHLTDDPRTAWHMAERELEFDNLHDCARLAFEGLWHKGKIKGSIELTTFEPKKECTVRLARAFDITESSNF